MKELFSKTIQVNEDAHISVIESIGDSILIQGFNFHYKDLPRGYSDNILLSNKAVMALTHILNEWAKLHPELQHKSYSSGNKSK